MNSSAIPLTHTGGFARTNAHVFEGPDGWIGVDAPDGTLDWLRRRGLRLGALLLTHAHFDHVEEAARIRREYGCPIFAWEVSTPESRLEHFIESAVGMRMRIENYPVDVLLADRTDVEVCGLPLRLAHVPGHSSDSVIFHDPAHARVFSGDTLMRGTVGRTDFPGGSEHLLLTGISRHLLTLPGETVVYPGHGESTSIAEAKQWFGQWFPSTADGHAR
ncbi:MAG: MBL fold metallo-hydrolase [Verrucomicrobiales bacterium]|nr:MBL fold metallo-hydrolase [Verrucomicrobiales bacterium]